MLTLGKSRLRYQVSHSSRSKREIQAEELVRALVAGLDPIVLVTRHGLELKHAKKMKELLQRADIHLIWKEDNDI
jgi:hypothetical protein